MNPMGNRRVQNVTVIYLTIAEKLKDFMIDWPKMTHIHIPLGAVLDKIIRSKPNKCDFKP